MPKSDVEQHVWAAGSRREFDHSLSANPKRCKPECRIRRDLRRYEYESAPSCYFEEDRQPMRDAWARVKGCHPSERTNLRPYAADSSCQVFSGREVIKPARHNSSSKLRQDSKSQARPLGLRTHARKFRACHL